MGCWHHSRQHNALRPHAVAAPTSALYGLPFLLSGSLSFGVLLQGARDGLFHSLVGNLSQTLKLVAHRFDKFRPIPADDSAKRSISLFSRGFVSSGGLARNALSSRVSHRILFMWCFSFPSEPLPGLHLMSIFP